MMGQTVLPIYPRTNYGQTNVYYKDSNNVYDLFVGTWTFTEGDISFTITLGKKSELAEDDYFEDVLVGGYKYSVNGVVLVNTLSLLQNNYSSSSKYTIFGSYIMGPNHPWCTNCNPDTRVAILSFWEPDRDVWFMAPRMSFERADAGGVQKLKVVFETTATASPTSLDHEPEYSSYTIPFGTYMLTKQ